MSGPPPPPPPHGGVPKGSGLPPGKYDIFVIPEHSAGSGFLYLPSLQPNTNSFAAGFASALLLVALFQSMAPAFRTWWDQFQGLGNAGMIMIIAGVGFGAWALGRTQQEGGTKSGPKPSFSSGGGGHAGAGGWGSQQSAGPDAGAQGPPPPPPPHNEGSKSPPPKPEQPNGSWQRPPDPAEEAARKAKEEREAREAKEKAEREARERKEAEERAREAKAREERLREEKLREERLREEKLREERLREEKLREERLREEKLREEKLKEERIREEKAREEKAKADKAKADKARAEAARGSWEKAREETRKREEERKAKEAEQKRREEAAKRLAELRAKEARERQEREAKKAKEEADKQKAAEALRKAAEAKTAELRATAAAVAAAAEEKKKKEEAAKAAAAAKEEATTKRGSSYAYSGVGEKMSMWPNGRPTPATPSHASTPSRPPPSSPGKPPAPSAKTYLSAEEEETHSYRPYDKPKRSHRGAPSVSSFSGSEASWAQSQTTAKTSPSPSFRGPYSTKDPDKIVVSGVYLFLSQYAKEPASQLLSGIGSVTDGLILRITTEGLFIDDDVRGVPQREWDVKAWTLSKVDVWCPPHCLTTPSNSTAKPPSTPLLHKMAGTSKAARAAAANKGTLTGEEADTWLAAMLNQCKSCCRVGDCEDHINQGGWTLPGGANGWRDKTLHVLRATVRDQDGKRYLFVVEEEEGWKLAIGLQRLRRGTQVRQLGVSGMTATDAKATLDLLGYQ